MAQFLAVLLGVVLLFLLLHHHEEKLLLVLRSVLLLGRVWSGSWFPEDYILLLSAGYASLM